MAYREGTAPAVVPLLPPHHTKLSDLIIVKVRNVMLLFLVTIPLEPLAFKHS